MVQDHDRWARWAYEQVLQRQAHVHFEGLWQLERRFFVVCPDPSALADDGRPIAEWFQSACRPITSPVQMVREAPPGSVRVAERTFEEILKLRGYPRTQTDLLYDLALALPPEFPRFHVIDLPPDTLRITFERKLAIDEHEKLKEVYTDLGIGFELQIEVDTNRDYKPSFSQTLRNETDITIIPSRWYDKQIDRHLRWALEDDEEFWRTRRHKLLQSPRSTPADALENSWLDSELPCVVDATLGNTHNLRTYLSLYQTVILALPLGANFSATLSSLGVSQQELLDVVQTGRVKLLLPQPLHRYPTSWLEAVAEVAPHNLILSRRLAIATILDARRRLPLLFPALSPLERHVVLNTMATTAQRMPPSRDRDWMLRMVQYLGGSWAVSEHMVAQRGPFAISAWGLGGFGAEAIQHTLGKDLFLEMWSASTGVEWAGLFNGHLFPKTLGDYDESIACEMLAGLYSLGRRFRTPHISDTSELSVVEDILALDNKVPITAFAKEFTGADITRLRLLVRNLTRENVDPDFLRKAIDDFNASVRQYERHPDRLNRVGVTGLMSSAVLLAPEQLREYLVALMPLLVYLVGAARDDLPGKSEVVGKITDYLNGLLAYGAPPDAVLVSRARKRIRILKG